MTRIVLPLLALTAALVACNPPTAKDRTTVWTDLVPVEGSDVSGRGIQLRAGVDAQARDMDSALEINLSVLANADSQPRVEMTLIDSLQSLENGPRATTVDGSAEIDIDPDFEHCDGSAYTLREDGGCTYDAGLLLISDQPYSVIVGVVLKTWAPEDWEGDPETVDVFADATPVDPQQ